MTVSQKAKYQGSGAGTLKAALINTFMLTMDHVIMCNVKASAQGEKTHGEWTPNSAFALRFTEHFRLFIWFRPSNFSCICSSCRKMFSANSSLTHCELPTGTKQQTKLMSLQDKNRIISSKQESDVVSDGREQNRAKRTMTIEKAFVQWPETQPAACWMCKQRNVCQHNFTRS